MWLRKKPKKEVINMKTIFKYQEVNGVKYINTTEIARVTGKHHANILRDIDDRRAPLNELSNISLEITFFQNEWGTPKPCYYLNEAQVFYLVMGFRGDKYTQLKINYINEIFGIGEEVEEIVPTKKPRIKEEDFYVKCVELDKQFQSVEECALYLFESGSVARSPRAIMSNVRNALNNYKGQKRAYGYTFEFIEKNNKGSDQL
jgi:Rha family phage regulatory protein